MLLIPDSKEFCNAELSASAKPCVPSFLASSSELAFLTASDRIDWIPEVLNPSLPAILSISLPAASYASASFNRST